jgi:hypothetical protein
MTKKMAIEILGFLKAEYTSVGYPLHQEALDMAIEALSSRRTVYGYSDGLKTGDRVLVSGTVADISETGVENILLDTDQEGYVITAGHGGKR